MSTFAVLRQPSIDTALLICQCSTSALWYQVGILPWGCTSKQTPLWKQTGCEIHGCAEPTLTSLQSQHLQGLATSQLCGPKPDLGLCDGHLCRGYSLLFDFVTLA